MMKDGKLGEEEYARRNMDGQKDAYAGVGPMTVQEDEPSTMAHVAVAFTTLVQHGLGRDDQVERMRDELRQVYRGNRYLEDRLHHKEAIMQDMTAQLVKLEDAVGSLERTFTALENGVNRRDELLTLAHALIKRVDTNRMAPNSDRLQWRRDRKAFFEACRETEPPTPVPVPSQGSVTHAHGSHGMHMHTEIEYLKHQQPIDREVVSDDEQHAMEMQQAQEDTASDVEYERIVQEARSKPAPAPDDATVARLQEEYHAARRTLRDARTAQRQERRRQYGESMAAPAVQVVEDDEDEYEGPPSVEQVEDEEDQD